MPPLNSPSAAARGFYLGVFFGRAGRTASRWTRFESELIALARSLHATIAYQGPGGAPCFERTVILATVSAGAIDRLESFVAAHRPLGSDSDEQHTSSAEWPPVVALAMSEEQFARAVSCGGAFPIHVEPVLIADFSALLDARRAAAEAQRTPTTP